MLKVKNVSITGMHNITTTKKYHVNDMNYIVGPNGVGKSTILQAIQLGVLGYIPGTSKKNGDIFAHANPNSREMIVEVALEDKSTGTTFSVKRTLSSFAGTVKMVTETVPEDFKIEEATDQISLPVFNFSEFMTMSSNQMKNWFINFLPKNKQDVDLAQEFDNEIANMTIIDLEYITKSKAKYLDIWTNGGEGIESLRQICEAIKQDISFEKGQSSRAQSTLQSLVRYDGFDADTSTLDSLQSAISNIDESISAYTSELTAIQNNQAAIKRASDYRNSFSIPENYNEEVYQEKLKTIQNIELLDLNKMKNKNNELISQIHSELNTKRNIVNGGGVCPYTNCSCDSILPMVKGYADDIILGESKIANLKKENEEIESKIAKLNREFQTISSTVQSVKSFRSTLEAYEAAIDNELDMSKSVEELAEAIQECKNNRIVLDEKVSKIKANEEYDKLYAKLNKERNQAEEHIEVLKAWCKIVDANGLQTSMMNEPFIELQNDITSYLQILFHDDNVYAKFNLQAKSNSFNFGLSRNGTYCNFGTLSSGEKCIYTLALFISILKKSSADLPLILIDDMLDHLDSDNIQSVLNGLQCLVSKDKNLQIILAGVQSPYLTNDEMIVHIYLDKEGNNA